MAEDPGFTVDLAHLATLLGPDPMAILMTALGQPNLITQSVRSPTAPRDFSSGQIAEVLPSDFPMRQTNFNPYLSEIGPSISTRGIAATPPPQGMAAPPLPQQTPPTQSPGNPPGPPRINLERALPPPGGFEGAGGVPQGLQQILMRIFSQRGLPFPSRGTGMFPGMMNQFGPGGLSNFGGGFGGAGGGDMSQILSMLGMRPDLLMDLLERQKRGMGQMGGM